MDNALKQTNLNLMASQDIVYLSSLDTDGFPQIRAMMNLRSRSLFPKLIPMLNKHEDDFITYLTTNMPTSKISDMKKNNQNCLYYCDTHGFHGLMLAGHIEIIRDQIVKNEFWQEEWLQYYPDGRNGKEYGLLKFTPIFAKGWHQMAPFQFNFKDAS